MARSTLPALLAALLACPAVLAETPPAGDRSAQRGAPEGFTTRIWSITDAVLEHHLDPPTRPQMILSGLEAVYRAAMANPPAGLAQRVSELEGPESLVSVLDAVWMLSLPGRGAAGAQGPGASVEDFLLNGLLAPVGGGVNLVPESERKVQEQFAGNSYVGLQIALGYDPEAKRPKVTTVMKGGPADRAGILEGDIIEEIDGVSTEGMGVAEAVTRRLRGALGTRVVIRVRQPVSGSRTITVTRGLLPRPTLKGIRPAAPGVSEYRVDGPGAIGYLKLEDLLGSTPHELRVAAHRLEEGGLRGLVLDMRSLQGENVHAAVLLADQLLERGTIGRLRRRGRVETFRAEPDALFRGWPLAVLVDNASLTTALWVAAALQDNGRATVVASRLFPDFRNGVVAPDRNGSRLARNGRAIGSGSGIYEFVSVVGGAWSLQMLTGRLERGDGSPVVLSPSPGPGAPGTFQGVRAEDVREGGGPAATGVEARPGLVPDLTVFNSATILPPRRQVDPIEVGGTSAGDPHAGDPALAAALRHLRATLETP